MPKRKAKILIVDDAQINQIILCELLRNQYQILEAEDGKKALEMIKEDKKIYFKKILICRFCRFLL